MSACPVQPRAAHAVGVDEARSPAVDVEPLVGDADAVAAVDTCTAKARSAPTGDVADALAGLPSSLAPRAPGRCPFLRVAARDREAAKDAERLQAALRGPRGAHHPLAANSFKTYYPALSHSIVASVHRSAHQHIE